MAVCVAIVGGPRGAQALMVSVAASLKDVVAEIGRQYSSSTGVDITYNVAGSGTLARQIESGAPVDVFVSAGWLQIARLQKQGLVAGMPTPLARNTVVVIVPKGSPWVTNSPRVVLSAEAVRRVATGDPMLVPFGEYAKQALEAAELWRVVKAKAVFATNVRQALAYVDRGAVDAGIVYQTDARLAKSAVLVGRLPGTDSLRIESVAIKVAGRDNEDADGFMATLAGKAAQGTFESYGFLRRVP